MNKRYGPDKVYKTKEQWDDAFETSARQVAATLNITMDQARVRQHALLESGLMEGFDPADKMQQMMVDLFMTDPAWDSQPKHFGGVRR